MTTADKGADRKRILFVVLLVVAVAAIPGRMAWSMRSDAAAEAAATRVQVDDLRTRIAKARVDQKKSAELNEQLGALAGALPPDTDLASVVEQLAALAKEANVTWKASAQNQPTDKRETTATSDETVPATAAEGTRSETLAEAGDQSTDTTAVATAATSSYLVEIDLEGTPANLTTFLEKLRSLPRLLTVERMTWAWRDGATGGSNTQLVSAHLSIKAYSWTGAPKSLTGGTASSGVDASTTTTTTAAGADPAP